MSCLTFFKKQKLGIYKKNTLITINKRICCQFGSTSLDCYLDLFLSLAKGQVPRPPVRMPEALTYVRKGRVDLYKLDHKGSTFHLGCCPDNKMQRTSSQH